MSLMSIKFTNDLCSQVRKPSLWWPKILSPSLSLESTRMTLVKVQCLQMDYVYISSLIMIHGMWKGYVEQENWLQLSSFLYTFSLWNNDLDSKDFFQYYRDFPHQIHFLQIQISLFFVKQKKLHCVFLVISSTLMWVAYSLILTGMHT